MADVLFTTKKYYDNNSIINANTDWQIIEPMIILVQDTYIQDIIGADMYADIKTKLIADPTMASEPAYESLIVDYIQKCVMWYVMTKAALVFKFRFANKGVMVKNSENSQPADTGDIKYLVDDFRNNAERYAQKLTEYLNKNSSTFPLYKVCTTHSNYSTGIDLEDDKYYCGCL